MHILSCQLFPLLSNRGFSNKFSEHEIWLQLCSLPAAGRAHSCAEQVKASKVGFKMLELGEEHKEAAL